MTNPIKSIIDSYRLGKYLKSQILLLPDFDYREGTRIILRKQRRIEEITEDLARYQTHILDYMPTNIEWKYLAIRKPLN